MKVTMYHPMERLRVHSGVRPIILSAAEGMVQPVFTPNASIIHSSILQIYLGTQKVAIYGALHRFTMSINGMDLRCMDPWLNICRVGFKSPRLELEIFTPLLTVNAQKG